LLGNGNAEHNEIQLIDISLHETNEIVVQANQLVTRCKEWVVDQRQQLDHQLMVQSVGKTDEIENGRFDNEDCQVFIGFSNLLL
jgi:hypothetical protein